MYPFSNRSLTSAIEKKIHQHLRKSEPMKYWIFTISNTIAKWSFTMAFAMCFLYIAASLLLHNPQNSDEQKRIVEFFSASLLALIMSGVVAEIVREALFKDLEQKAMKAAQSI